MIDVILLVSRNQRWLYMLLAGGGAWQVWLWWRANHRLRYTVFGVERGALLAARGRATALIFIIAALAAAVALLSAFIAPNLTELFGVPPTPTPQLFPTPVDTVTATPQLVLPGLDTATPAQSETPVATRTPVPAGGASCANPNATITSPIPGAILAGEVEVSGTANVDNFAFYVVEISTLGDNWLAVITSQPDAIGQILPVVNGVLGKWDTGLQQAGDYALRLVVFDSAGQHPDPCTPPITIAPRP